MQSVPITTKCVSSDPTHGEVFEIQHYADLFRVHLANDPGCICGCAFEDAIHYILECCLYNEAREELKLRLVFLNELKIEVLLFGDDTLTEKQNLQIFKSVQLYIKRTKRFTHLWSPTPSQIYIWLINQSINQSISSKIHKYGKTCLYYIISCFLFCILFLFHCFCFIVFVSSFFFHFSKNL